MLTSVARAGRSISTAAARARQLQRAGPGWLRLLGSVRSYQYDVAVGSGHSAGLSVPLFHDTPYIRSDALSHKLASSAAAGPEESPHGPGVFLKLDLLQPTGSFKDRGVSHLCHTLRRDHGARALVTASGGNAGLAVARAGQVLGMDVRVVVPETAKPVVLERMREFYGANVEVFGENFDAANARALEMAADDATAHYVHPYDHPLLWEGHASLVDEIAAASGGEAPGVIVASVGGGGLLRGVYEGLVRRGWFDTTIIAAETHGADCLAQALAAGHPVTLPGITSIATSLGSRTVCQAAFDAATSTRNVAAAGDNNSGGSSPSSPSSSPAPSTGIRVESRVFSDAAVVATCHRFLDDHRLLVEPACAAALSVAYDDPAALAAAARGRAVAVVVCGGSGVSLDILSKWGESH